MSPLFWWLLALREYKARECTDSTRKSLLDVGFPWTYQNFTVELNLQKQKKPQLSKLSPTHLIVEGELGELLYAGQSYKLKRLSFQAPSRHTVNGLRYGLELTLHGLSKHNTTVVAAKLFEEITVYSNPELFAWGFGSGRLAALRSTVKRDSQPLMLNATLDLAKLWGDSGRFLLYEGSSPVSCDPALVFVSKHVGWVGSEQLAELNRTLPAATVRGSSAFVFQNFASPAQPQFNDTRAPKPTDTIVPAELDKPYHMFEPRFVGQPLGFFPDFAQNNERIPLWDKRVVGLEKVFSLREFRRDGPFSFVPVAFDRMESRETRSAYYAPLYALVPNGFTVDMGVVPPALPMLLRTNYTRADGTRPVLLINVPVQHIMANQTAPQTNNTEAYEEICLRYMLSVVLNRNFAHEGDDRAVQDLIDRAEQMTDCVRKMIVVKGTADFHRRARKPGTADGDAHQRLCSLVLETVLNNRGGDWSGISSDYVSSRCENVRLYSALMNAYTKMNAGLDVSAAPASPSQLRSIVRDEQTVLA